MKKTITLISLAVLTLTLCTQCRKEKDKETNTVTISGNATEEMNGILTPDECLFFLTGECSQLYDRTVIQLMFTTDAALEINLYVPAGSLTVVPGTYSLQSTCTMGFDASFYPTYFRKSPGLWFSGGTLVIAKEGEVYDIDLDLVIDSECGGGTFKGNYRGTISEAIAR